MLIQTSKAKSAAAERFQKVVNAASGGSVGIDAEGGYLVETDKAASILTTAIETGVTTITSLDTAKALVSSLEHQEEEKDLSLIDVAKL